MTTNYEERLRLPIVNQLPHITFESIQGEQLATAYTRIEIGGHGPYVEFDPMHIIWNAFYIPPNLRWKKTSDKVYYVEYRSILDNVKLYYQRKEVNYATYKIGMCYISPFELFFYSEFQKSWIPIIEKLSKSK